MDLKERLSADFAQRLSVIMQEKGVTAYKIGIETNGITEAMVGKWKNGNSLPSFEKIYILSNYLGVSCDYLLTGHEKNTTLTEREEKLLKWYRESNEAGQNYILMTSEMVAEKYKKDNTVPGMEENIG